MALVLFLSSSYTFVFAFHCLLFLLSPLSSHPSPSHSSISSPLQLGLGPALQPGPVRQGEAVPPDAEGEGHAGDQEAAAHGETTLPAQLTARGTDSSTTTTITIPSCPKMCTAHSSYTYTRIYDLPFTHTCTWMSDSVVPCL